MEIFWDISLTALPYQNSKEKRILRYNVLCESLTNWNLPLLQRKIDFTHEIIHNTIWISSIRSVESRIIDTFIVKVLLRIKSNGMHDIRSRILNGIVLCQGIDVARSSCNNKRLTCLPLLKRRRNTTAMTATAVSKQLPWARSKRPIMPVFLAGFLTHLSAFGGARFLKNPNDWGARWCCSRGWWWCCCLPGLNQFQSTHLKTRWFCST